MNVPDNSSASEKDASSLSDNEASTKLHSKEVSSSLSEDSSSQNSKSEESDEFDSENAYSAGEASSTLNAKKQRAINNANVEKNSTLLDLPDTYKDDLLYSEIDHPDKDNLFDGHKSYIDKRNDSSSSSSGSSSPVKLEFKIKLPPQIDCCNDHQLMTQEQVTDTLLLNNEITCDKPDTSLQLNTKDNNRLDIKQHTTTTNEEIQKNITPKKGLGKSERKTIIKKPSSPKRSNHHLEDATVSYKSTPKDHVIDISKSHGEKSKEVSSYCNLNIIHKVKQIKQHKTKTPVRKKLLFPKPKNNKTLSQCGFFPVVSFTYANFKNNCTYTHISIYLSTITPLFIIE